MEWYTESYGMQVMKMDRKTLNHISSMKVCHRGIVDLEDNMKAVVVVRQAKGYYRMMHL